MMLHRSPWCFAVFTLSAAVLAMGCGGTDCESLCEEARQCEGNDGFAGDSCTEECSEAQDLADEADCGDQFDDYVDCVSGADICNIEDSECQGEGFSYGFCVLSYCQDNPNEPACASSGSGCTSYGAGGAPDCFVGQTCGEGPENELRCDGESCVCSVDANEQATVPYDASFCEGDLDDQVSAAASACGW